MHLKAAEPSLPDADSPTEAPEVPTTAVDPPSGAADSRELAAESEGEAGTFGGVNRGLEGGAVVSQGVEMVFGEEGARFEGGGVEDLSAAEGDSCFWPSTEGFTELGLDHQGVGVLERSPCIGAVTARKGEGLSASEGLVTLDSNSSGARVDLGFSVGVTKIGQSSDLASRMESVETLGNAQVVDVVEEKTGGRNVKSALSKSARRNQRDLDVFAKIAAFLVLFSSALMAIVAGISFDSNK